MVLFGNITITGYNISHQTVTPTDVAINYGCGAAFVLLSAVGTTLSPFLYYYHWKTRVSWSARYYRFLAFVSFTTVLAGAVPMAVYLLMPLYIHDIDNSIVKAVNQLLMLCFEVSFASQITVVFKLSLMLWIYIHKPFWSIHHAAAFKRIGMALILFFVFLFVGCFAVIRWSRLDEIQWSEEIQCTYAKHTYVVLLLRSPQYLLVLLSLAFYVTTLVMIKIKSRATKQCRGVPTYHDDRIIVTGTLKCQLITIGLLVSGSGLWACLKIVGAGVEASENNTPYEQLYFLFVATNLVPAFLAVYNSFVIVACCDDKVRDVVRMFLKTGKLEACNYDLLDSSELQIYSIGDTVSVRRTSSGASLARGAIPRNGNSTSIWAYIRQNLWKVG